MKRVIATVEGPAALGPYSQAVAVGDALFCSGQIPIVPTTGELIAGDVKAQARLEAWNAIVLKYQPEIEQMTLTAQAGDLTAMHTMQRMQPDMMRDWSRTSRTKQSTRVVGAKIPRP